MEQLLDDAVHGELDLSTRDVVEEERVIPDEDVHDYDDREVVAPAGTTATTTDDDRTMVAAGDSPPERVEISDPERRDTP